MLSQTTGIQEQPRLRLLLADTRALKEAGKGTGRLGPFQAVGVRSLVTGPTATVAGNFDDGMPAVVERKVGRGQWCISPGCRGWPLEIVLANEGWATGGFLGFDSQLDHIAGTPGQRLIVGHGRPPDDQGSDADLLGWNCGHTPQLERRASAGGPGGCSERQERRTCGERAAWKAAIPIRGRSYSFRSASGKRGHSDAAMILSLGIMPRICRRLTFCSAKQNVWVLTACGSRPQDANKPRRRMSIECCIGPAPLLG